MSKAFKKLFGAVSIPFPERLNPEAIKEVRIHPKYQARFFEVELVSQVEPEPVETVVDSAISIDFGLDNLATCVDTNGASFIVDGRKLKSINQWFNKENARLQSIKDRQKIERLTERQARLLVNRNNQVRDYLNKTARLIIDHCIAHKIERMIVGFNLGMKQEINIGSRNNQNFVQIPFHTLRGKLKSLCELKPKCCLTNVADAVTSSTLSEMAEAVIFILFPQWNGGRQKNYSSRTSVLRVSRRSPSCRKTVTAVFSASNERLALI
jgi:IS605 OrfB family transposase